VTPLPYVGVVLAAGGFAHVLLERIELAFRIHVQRLVNADQFAQLV
jgi:hypothetical protein